MLLGYSYEEIYLLFKKYANQIKYLDFNNILKGVYGLIFKRRIIINGLNSGKKLEKIINEACKEKNIHNINQIKMPIIVPSVNLHTGEIYCFCSKNMKKANSNNITYINNSNIGKAVRSSCSYPVIFSPCKYNNLELVDGGLRENIPWKETKAMGAEKVISVVFEKTLKNRNSDNILDVVSSSMDIVLRELYNCQIEGADCLLKIKTEAISLLDMGKIDELYEIGYREAKKNISKIKSMV